MDNLAAVTTELKTLSKDLPEVFDSINTSLEKLDSTIGTVDSLLDGSSDDIAVAIANTAELTRQANETLKQTEQLLSSGEPAVEQLPKLMRTTNSALESIDELSQTLNRSWLFGGRKKTTNKAD
jgi:ABC-type transporter Mla subunit MlaD